MKTPETMRHPRNFKRSDSSARLIRMKLIGKRLKQNRYRIKMAATQRGLSGFVLGLVSLAAAIALTVGGYYTAAILNNYPDVEELEELAGPEGRLYQLTRYYDRTGQVLIPGNDVSHPDPAFLELVTNPITEEAHRFTAYLEALMAGTGLTGGVDLNKAAPNTQAATVAERLVSDLLLSGELTSHTRDIRVKLLAAQASNQYGQANLENWYFNSTDYGRGTLGVNSAAALYFNKTIFQINAGEALILAVITLDPAVNPIDTPNAFNISLQTAGTQLLNQGLVDNFVLQQAESALATIKARQKDREAGIPAFYAAAREQFSRDTGSNHPEQGGLSVVTTMNIQLQTRLECALFEMFGTTQGQLECGKALSGTTAALPKVVASDDLRFNFVLLDPTSGQVQAMLGDYSPAIGEQSYLQPHPSGSLVTPFIYLTGLLQGMSPATLVWDTPTGLDESVMQFYSAKDEFKGPMSLRTALSGDHLAPAAKLLANYGQDNVTSLMASFGLHLYASEGIPYTSGIADSLSVAQAYGILANGGTKAGSANQQQSGILMPTMILRAVDNNDRIVLEKDSHQEQTLISPALAFLINDILASDTADVPKINGSSKSGISDDGADYWRVVYTPEYVFVLWLGYTDPVGKPGLSDLGIDTALIRILEESFPQDPKLQEWQIPAGITRLEVCTPSGMLPGEACPQTVMEFFLAGTEPVEVDNLYKEYPVDVETGRLATVFTDPAHIIQRVYLNPPPEELSWALAAGYPLPPGEYAIYQPGSASGNTVILEPMNFERAQGKITILGSMEPAGFISYRLDLGDGLAPSQWLQVGATMTTLPAGNVLGTLDTNRFENGLYTLRIQVLRSGNLADNSYVVILIDNPTAIE